MLLGTRMLHARPMEETVHGLQLGLDGEDEHLNVGQDVPAVAAAGARNGSGGRQWQIDGAQDAGVRHRPDIVRRRRPMPLRAVTDTNSWIISRTHSYRPAARLPDAAGVAGMGAGLSV